MSSRYMKAMVWAISSGVLMFAVVGSAHAAKPKDPVKEAQRRMQIEMMKVQDEKAAMGVEFEAIKKKADDLEATSVRAEHRRAMLDKEVTGLRQEKTVLVEKMATLEQKLAEAQRFLAEEKKSLTETQLHLDQETGKRQGLEQNLSVRGKALAVCETKNKMLYQYHVELVNRAQNRGSLDAFLEAEPILGFKRVQIENLLEEYRDKLDEQKINSTTFSEAPGK